MDSWRRYRVIGLRLKIVVLFSSAEMFVGKIKNIGSKVVDLFFWANDCSINNEKLFNSI
jgi:hypothetical protein